MIKKNHGFALILSLCWFFMSVQPAYAWTYRVKQGDSLYKLSRRFGSSVRTLKRDNRLVSSRIRVGQRLWIPDVDKQKRSRVSASVKSNDMLLLARLISGEARGETYKGQVAVGAVILNRMDSGHFPRTIRGNIFMPGQFESVSNGQIWKALPSSAIKAAKAALAGYDPTGGAVYFYNPGKIASRFNWIWSRPIISKIGSHVFAI